MKKKARTSVKNSARRMSAVVLPLIVVLGTPVGVSADEADARRLLKGMSDFLAAQNALSFEYDASLEIVTVEEQTLALTSSGTVTVNRPDKIRFMRSSGFVDVEMSFDGQTLTVMGKNFNRYAQIDVPGTIDGLFDELRDTYNRPIPAADLLLSDSYEALMRDVVDVKDLGSGVVGGVECDFLAFRKEEIDWQIWIAQGESPYPCRYVISSKLVTGRPQYTIQMSDWKTGDEVVAADFRFENSTNAVKVELGDLEGAEELPAHFRIGESQ
jgi:hypothetical protein